MRFCNPTDKLQMFLGPVQRVFFSAHKLDLIIANIVVLGHFRGSGP
jgi:hypothetical protein